MTYYVAKIVHPLIRAAGFVIYAFALPVMKANNKCEEIKERGKKP